MRRSIFRATVWVLVLLLAGLVGTAPARLAAQEKAPAALDELGNYVTIIPLGETESLQGNADQALYLDLLIFDDARAVPPLTYGGAQVLYINAGSLTFQFVEVRGNAQVTRTPTGERCTGDECNVQNYLGESITLTAGDALTHDGEIVYSVEVTKPVEGARRANFGAPSGALGNGASGQRACASGCG